MPGRYPHLLAPGRIGSVEIRNRIVMPAMDQNNCTDQGLVAEATVAHYEERAAGGAGLLILETSAVSWPHGATARHQPALSHDGWSTAWPVSLGGSMRTVPGCSSRPATTERPQAWTWRPGYRC